MDAVCCTTLICDNDNVVTRTQSSHKPGFTLEQPLVVIFRMLAWMLLLNLCTSQFSELIH